MAALWQIKISRFIYFDLSTQIVHIVRSSLLPDGLAAKLTLALSY